MTEEEYKKLILPNIPYLYQECGTPIDENIGNDDWFYNHPDSMTFEAVYFNPDSNAGGQYVIMTLPYELISDAVEQTNDKQSFFEFLEERASHTELVDITDKDFRATMEDYKTRPADFIGRSQNVMDGIIKTVAKEVNAPVLSEYLGDSVDEIATSCASTMQAQGQG